jgi:hypothetical protein
VALLGRSPRFGARSAAGGGGRQEAGRVTNAPSRDARASRPLVARRRRPRRATDRRERLPAEHLPGATPRHRPKPEGRAPLARRRPRWQASTSADPSVRARDASACAVDGRSVVGRSPRPTPSPPRPRARCPSRVSAHGGERACEPPWSLAAVTGTPRWDRAALAVRSCRVVVWGGGTAIGRALARHRHELPVSAMTRHDQSMLGPRAIVSVSRSDACDGCRPLPRWPAVEPSG